MGAGKSLNGRGKKSGEEKSRTKIGALLFSFLTFNCPWVSEDAVFVDNYTGKGAIYYVTIATVTFSRAKITCFRVNAHLVFHWCLYARQD